VDLREDRWARLRWEQLNDLLLGGALVWVFSAGFFESFVLVQFKSMGLSVPYLAFQALKFGALGILLFLFLFPFRWKVGVHPVVFLLAGTVAIYSIIGLRNPEVIPSNVVLNIKNNYLWLVLMLIIGYSGRPVKKKVLLTLLIASLLLGLLNVGYSLLVNLSYDGSPRDFYFFDLYNSMGMYGEANFFRNGSIRSFGLVGSCLTLSQILLIPLSFSLSLLIHHRGRFVALLAVLLLACGEWLTRTRNPSIAILIAFCAYALLRSTRRLLPVIVFVVGYLLVSFYYLVQASFADVSSLDLSALNRGKQLLQISEAILERPFGYGIGYVGVANGAYKVWTDLSFGTVLLELGVVPIIMLIGGAFGLLRFAKLPSERLDEESRILTTTFFLICVSMVVLSEYSNIFDTSLFSFSIMMGAILNRIRHSGVMNATVL
jgi:hypothetical protein